MCPNWKSFKIQEETAAKPGEKLDELRVMKLDTVNEPVVSQFQFQAIEEAGKGSYAVIKSKYGAIAPTDMERTNTQQRERRFSLNPLVKEPLSVAQEERRIIDEKVEKEIRLLSIEAREKGEASGYEAGLKKGYEEAFSKFKVEAADKLASFEKMVALCEQAKSEIFKANERFLVETVFRLVRMVTLKELSTDREYVLRLAREILEKVGVRENIRLRIHPKDFETLSLLRQGLESSLGSLKNLNIEVSNQIQEGGCFVETQWNAIDACIETQLKGVHDALLGADATPDTDHSQ